MKDIKELVPDVKSDYSHKGLPLCDAEEVQKQTEQLREAIELLMELKSDSCGYPDDHENMIDDFIEQFVDKA
ncbi:hypothetical protein [Oceanispirochaeta sp.]|uniref:hypothetical protein n=1 Tax=Oceanispirochaeta sp. TaxID=2035350 RepID=UPI00262A0C95|nr:hypothetical protein [Oceanispirochaeta sp.]MDA3958394.1 hypothetical protein [Oceanispirochaeta sp.]